MFDQATLNIEATKLLKEWSVWMVGVQSALIGFLATSTPTQSGNPTIAINISLVCFAVSVLAAAWVLSALPYVVIRLLEEGNPNIYYMRLSGSLILNRIPLWLMGAIQHWAFALGVISLVFGKVTYGVP